MRRSTKIRRKVALSFSILLFSLFSVIILAIKYNLFYPSFPNPGRNLISYPIRVYGNKIFDQNNHEIILHGLNYHELNDSGFVYKPSDRTKLPPVCQVGDEYPPEILDASKVKAWGFNTVRLVIRWDQIEKSAPKADKNGQLIHEWNSKYMKSLDKILEILAKEKLAVILDLHQYNWSDKFTQYLRESGKDCSGSGMPKWLYPGNADLQSFNQAKCDLIQNTNVLSSPINPQTGFIEVWKYLSQRYKNYSNIIAYDLLNEPEIVDGYCDFKDLRLTQFYETIGREIRLINPNITLIFSDTVYRSDNQYALTKPSLKNIIFSCHTYAGRWTEDGNLTFDSCYRKAMEMNMPLFVGEFYSYGPVFNRSDAIYGNSWKSDFQNALSFFRKNKISWAFWSYSGSESLLDYKSREAKKDIYTILENFL